MLPLFHACTVSCVVLHVSIYFFLEEHISLKYAKYNINSSPQCEVLVKCTAFGKPQQYLQHFMQNEILIFNEEET